VGSCEHATEMHDKRVISATAGRLPSAQKNMTFHVVSYPRNHHQAVFHIK